MEKFDIFDEAFNKLKTEPKTYEEVHYGGLWHQTFGCWLINKERNTIILQLRGAKNFVDPGSIDVSAGGHLASGEKPDDGFREVEEELGVSIPEESKYYLGMFRNIAVREKFVNREFCHIYMASVNYTLEDFKPQEGEVDGVYEADINELIALFKGIKNKAKVRNLNGNLFVVAEDFCNYDERTRVSNYYLKVLLAAQDLLSGRDIVII